MKYHRITFCLIIFLLLLPAVNAQRKMERLDRGIVAIPKSSSQIYISWRHFATDPDDIAYNLYYKTTEAGTLIKLNINPITNSTNYTASLNTSSATYTFVIKSIINGVEKDEPGSFTLPQNTVASRIVHDFNFQPLPDGHPTMGMKFCWPADLNGDGKYDYVLDRQNYGAVTEDGTGGAADYPSPKVEAYNSDGTFLWRIDMGPNVKICSGHNDMVTAYDMDGNGKAEVLMAVSEGTTFADGKVITGTNGQVTNYRTIPGSAPQWISIVNGETGVEIDRVPLPYFDAMQNTRTDDWKEMSGHFIIAYLDGIRPSLIYQYKTRAANGNFQGSHAAWSFRDGKLQLEWSNRFYPGQAEFHQVRVADVNGDGRDNFVEGGYVLNHDGTLMNLHKDAIHGDRHMLGDIDPDRPGLEHFTIQQDNPKTLGMALYDAQTGEMIKGIYQSAVGDVGRGICAAFDPNRRGLQFWSTMQNNAMFDCKGNQIPNAYGNFPAEAVWWGPNLSRYELNGVNSSGSNVAFHKINAAGTGMDRDLPNLYNESNGNGAYYFAAANGARAAFWGDLFGDWREELIFCRSNQTGFVVLSTWEQTNIRLYHLMQNPAYRGQTTQRGYYQTPDVDFYMAADMPKPPIAPVQQADIYYTTSGWIDEDDKPVAYTDSKSIMYDIRGGNSTVNMSTVMKPSKVYLMNPKGSNYTFTGSGKFSGNMDLIKSLQGTVIFNNQHDFTGKTRISEGKLVVTGNYISPVQVDARGVIAGNATLLGGITLEKGLNREGARIEPGALNETGIMTIEGNLVLSGRNNLAFRCDQTKALPASKLIINGNFTVSGTDNCIIIQPLTVIQEGTLTLISFTGTTNATASSFTVVGLEGIPYTLKVESNAVIIAIEKSRSAAQVSWMGSQSTAWDFKTPNFVYGSLSGIFVPGDSVYFGDEAIRKSIVISETMPVGGLTFNNNTDYTISGQGVISGTSGLKKSGSGKLSIQNTENTFTGKVEIDGGVLEVASLKDGGLPSSIGASSSASSNWIMRDATLQTRAQMSTNRSLQVTGKLTVNNPNTNNSVLLSGNIVGSGVSLELNGKGTLTLQGTNSLNTVTLNDGLLFLGSADANRYSMGASKITLNGGIFRMFDINSTSNTGTFSNEIEVPNGKNARWDLPSRWNIASKLTGAGQIQVQIPYVRSDLNGDWSQFTGKINFTGRDVRLNSATSRNMPLAEVNLGDGTYLMAASNGSNELSGGQTFTFGALSGTGTISGRNFIIVGGNNANTTFSGVMNDGAGRLTKKGTGTLTLTGANLHTGGTVVENGTLLVANTTGSATGTGTVTVSNGGILSGTGIIAGATSIGAGAKLIPGAVSYGTLNFGSNLNLFSGSTTKFRIAANNNDKLNVTGNLTLKGTLELQEIGSVFAAGKSFTLFTAGSTSGTFDNIIPEIPGEGLQWNISRLSEGIISIDVANGIEDITGANVRVWPVPVKDNCHVSIGTFSGDVKIELINQVGIIILSEIVSHAQVNHIINMSDFQSGFYFVKISELNNKSFLRKIIKQ